jgi:DNA mismatch repair protein MutS
MGFASILWPGEPGETADERPPFFPDLSLDQVVEGILAGRAEYDLTPFFHTPLRDLEAIRYRQEVFRELENPALTGCVQRFAQRMRAVREHLAMSHKLYYKYQKAGYFLDAVELYCQAVRALWGNLVALQPAAAGWRGLQGYLAGYLRSQSFTSLEEEVQGLQQALGSVRYKMLIQGDRVTVLPYEAESNYGAEIEATFARFRQGVVKDYRVKFSDWAEMNHVEAQILDGVAYLYPALFERLLDFPRRYAGYPDRMVAAFDREVQFYLAYLEYLSGLRAARLPFCYPRVGKSKEVAVRGGFDLALAKRLASEGHAVVGNDFFLQGHERILVVSGPNQGGKTTFARMFGQVHYLASLGCAVRRGGSWAPCGPGAYALAGCGTAPAGGVEPGHRTCEGEGAAPFLLRGQSPESEQVARERGDSPGRGPGCFSRVAIWVLGRGASQKSSRSTVARAGKRRRWFPSEPPEGFSRGEDR